MMEAAAASGAGARGTNAHVDPESSITNDCSQGQLMRRPARSLM